jgi:hypothetical protein
VPLELSANCWMLNSILQKSQPLDADSLNLDCRVKDSMRKQI